MTDNDLFFTGTPFRSCNMPSPSEIARQEAATLSQLTDAQRKAIPIATGALDYFPDALLAVAELSRIGNEQHNPGQPLHWARGKSTAHADSLLRHMIERGTFDSDGVRHSAKVAWRALAQLQTEIEEAREVELEPTRWIVYVDLPVTDAAGMVFAMQSAEVREVDDYDQALAAAQAAASGPYRGRYVFVVDNTGQEVASAHFPSGADLDSEGLSHDATPGGRDS